MQHHAASALVRRIRLEIMQIVDRTLGMGRRGKDESLLVPENLKPARQVAGMIRPRLELWHDAEVSC